MLPQLHRVVEQQIVAQRVLEHLPVQAGARGQFRRIEPAELREVPSVARDLQGVVALLVRAELGIVGVDPRRGRVDRIRAKRFVEVRLGQGRIGSVRGCRALAPGG